MSPFLLPSFAAQSASITLILGGTPYLDQDCGSGQWPKFSCLALAREELQPGPFSLATLVHYSGDGSFLRVGNRVGCHSFMYLYSFILAAECYWDISSLLENLKAY